MRARETRAGSSPPAASDDSRPTGCTECSRRTRPSPILSTSSCRAPSWAAGPVYFGSGDGNVYALDAQTGDLKWKFQTGDVVHASPAYADGVVFVGSWDSYFYALDARTGAEKWRFHGGEDALMHNQVGFQSSAAVVNGVVYVGCRDSNLYAIDAATGKEKWRFNNSGSWVISSPAVTQGKVIFGTSDSSALSTCSTRRPARRSPSSKATPTCSRRRRSRAMWSTSAC